MTALRIIISAAIAFVFYVLGAKAGRGRYKQIQRSAKKTWNDPTVKKARKLANRNTKKIAKAAHR